MSVIYPKRNVTKTNDNNGNDVFTIDGIIRGDKVRFNHAVEVGTKYMYTGGHIEYKENMCFKDEADVITVYSDGALLLKHADKREHVTAREMVLKLGLDYEE